MHGSVMMTGAIGYRLPKEYVVIYTAQSKIGEIIEAEQAADADAVKLLRDLVRDDSAERLQAIREILDS